MKEACLWYDTSPEPLLALSPLQGHHTTEVAVIGVGITGLSTALHLAEAGVAVVLVEAGDIPSGGSGRNVGPVNAGLWIPPDDIVKTLGEEDGERVNTILGGAPGEVLSLIERHGIKCRATRTVVGKGFARYLTTGDDSLLPLPIRFHKPVRGKSLWSMGYESGFTLYHTGQCLRILS